MYVRMPNTPNASFIPKQGPVKRTRHTATRQIHVFSILTYVLFAASLAASLGVFLFNRHLEKQLDAEIEALNGAIGGFNNSDMEMVREFNIRLKQAEARVSHSISLTSLFASIEAATAQTVEITELKLDREQDQQIKVAAKLSTDSFDSSLFQRGVLERNDVIESVVVKDVAISTGDTAGVSFLATLFVPLGEIPYTAPLATQATPVIEQATTTPDTTAVAPTEVPPTDIIDISEVTP